MHKKLTPKTIDALPPAKGKRYEVRDDIVTGLLIRVSSTGSKVWYLATRIDDTARRLRLGTYPVLSLADARTKAREVLRQIQMGEFVEAKAAPKILTLGDTIPKFIALWAKPRNRSWKEAERMLGKFAALYDRPLADIRRRDVVVILDEIMAEGKGMSANRALASIKKLFAWSVDRGDIEFNPLAGLRPPAKERPRDRVLSEAEIIGCWRAAETEGFPFEQFAKLVILTGQRRGEVAEMEWAEIDFERATWTIPARRAKNATQHAVPLAPLAVSLLQSVPRFLNCPYVFSTTGSTPISGFRKLKDRLEEAVGTNDWRLHDIRRTVATNMAMLGIQPHVIEAVLNHKSGIVSGVAAIYNRHAYTNEKREALEKWAEHVERITRIGQDDSARGMAQVA